VPTLRLAVDQDKARSLGVSSQAIRRTLQGSLSGMPLGQLRQGEKTIDVLLREPDAGRNNLAAVEQAYVTTAGGGSVPLAQVARVSLELEDGIRWRRDRLPTITVRAALPDSVQPPDVSAALMKQLQPLIARLPAGYSIEAGGAIEESAKSQASINAKMPLMAIAWLLLLMIQLQHVGRMVLVLLTAPLALMGAAAGLLALDAPFGFVAILGVIALAGMIMRNSVILVDQIDQDIRAGHDPATAIAEAAVRRFRPIMLTAAAAVLAMIPLAESVFWGPMAVAMMGGLIGATVLTLTFLPALYAAWFRVEAARTEEGGAAIRAGRGGPFCRPVPQAAE
jgi:multidrug efflux pump subunit AcrB